MILIDSTKRQVVNMVMARNSRIASMLRKELNPFERFTDMLSGRDDRQDIQIMLLYEIALLLSGQPPEGEEGAPIEFPSGMQVNVPLTVEPIDLLDNVAALTTDVIYPGHLADCRKALRTIIIVNNGFNQQVSMQVIGHTQDVPTSGTFQIGSAVNIAAGAKAAYGIKVEEWMPYIGVEITPAVSPTAGTVNAIAILQVQGE